MRKSKNKFTLHGDYVDIYMPEWPKLAFATIRADYADKLQSVTWSRNGDYLSNKKMGGLLHRYIAEKWYGHDVLGEMNKAGFIVEHLDNNGFDCRIENLYFLASNENKAKGMTTDKLSDDLIHRIALNIFRDFSTGLFQITIFFNEDVHWINEGVTVPISTIRLLYNTDYRIVINDAKSILDHYELYERCNLDKLNFVDIKIEKAQYVVLTPKEMEHYSGKNAMLINRNGREMVILDGNTTVTKIYYDKGWLPNDKGDLN